MTDESTHTHTHLPFLPLSDEDSSADSGSDVEVKTKGRRHKLLNKKLTLSEGETDDEKPAKSKKEGKRKGRRKGKRTDAFTFVYLCSVRCKCQIAHEKIKHIHHCRDLSDDIFISLIPLCGSVNSDDSADSDFKQSGSDSKSEESALSEAVSEEEEEDDKSTKRKTR